jgi:hypothetical protein
MKTLPALAIILTVATGTVHAEKTFAENHEATLLAEDRAALTGAEEGLRADLLNWEATPASQAAAVAIRKLLSLPRLQISDSSGLEGDWRVRSLQVSPYGANAYPYFPCRIFPEGEALVFQKSQGSQRRQGILGRAGDAEFLFIGASYYQGDPVPLYSGIADSADASDRKKDSVGTLHRVGEDHLLILFAPRDGRKEIYELVR